MAKFNIVVTGNMGCGITTSYDILIKQLSKLTSYSVATFSYNECVLRLLKEPLFKQLMNTIFKTCVMSEIEDIIDKDTTKSNTLDGIIRPLINPQIIRVIDDVDTDIAVLEMPTWFEDKMNQTFKCHSLVVVTADEDTQIDRLIEHNGWTQERATQLMNRQLPQAIKIDAASYVVSNMYTLDTLRQQLDWYVNNLEYSHND